LEQLAVGQSSFGSAESTTSAAAAVAPEPAMEFNMDPSVVLPPSASEEPTTSPTGTSLDADMNADSGIKNKSIQLLSHQITPTNTLGMNHIIIKQFKTFKNSTPFIIQVLILV